MTKKTGIAIALLCLGLSIIGSIAFGLKKYGSNQSDSRKTAKLVLIVQQKDYYDGQLDIRGTARNIGDGPAKSPLIHLVIVDETGKFLAEESTRLEGYSNESLPPEASAPFKLNVSVPGKPAIIDGQLSVEGVPFDIKWPIERTGK
jgi:hypothetical protein